MKNIYFISILIIAIGLNLMVGVYFIFFKQDILESLFHSVIPFLLLCIGDGILIITLVIKVLKQNNPKTHLMPQTEERGFIFMDLDNSTAIAETLKHQQYSNFLKDTFSMLGEILEKVDGLEVYQYVGDEAVLSWELSNEEVNNTILGILPIFQKKLFESKEYFKTTYGIVPSFKCAIHGGEVTKTFLGKYQKQTVFHGDVLNTTSRILGMCHHYQTCVLVSEFVFQKVQQEIYADTFKNLGAINIQGKSQEISLHKMNCTPFYHYLKIYQAKFSIP